MRSARGRIGPGVLLLALVLAWAPARAADAPQVRLALVAGVSAYPEGSQLPNGVNDAKAVAGKLPGVGFELVGGKPLVDVRRSALKQAVRELYDRAKAESAKGADVTVLFYFSGHGVQFGGNNYLIPQGAELFDPDKSPTEPEYEEEAVKAQFVLDQLASSGARRVIIILDACRVNPFNPRERAIAKEGGLAAMGPPEVDHPADAMIFYASEPRRPALDGTGANSPFSSALVEFLGYAGMTADEMFSNVRNRVIVETKQKQRPYFEGALTDFRFDAGAATGDPSHPAPPKPAAGIDLNRPGTEVLTAVLKTKSLAAIRGLADEGDGFSQWLVSNAYLNAVQTPRDITAGRQWARRAVADGVGRAAGTLGWSYLHDAAGPNYAEAIAWFEVGVTLKDASSLNNLGLLCVDSANDRERLAGARMLRSAAALGYSPAMYFLARTLMDHVDDERLQEAFGVSLPAAAVKLYEQAYAAGWAPAAADLAYLYGAELGATPARDGFAADPVKAAFYKKQPPGSDAVLDEPRGKPAASDLTRACATR